LNEQGITGYLNGANRGTTSFSSLLPVPQPGHQRIAALVATTSAAHHCRAAPSATPTRFSPGAIGSAGGPRQPGTPSAALDALSQVNAKITVSFRAIRTQNYREEKSFHDHVSNGRG
jgi:hypothetical protein